MPVNMTKYVIIFQIVGMLNMMFGLFDVMTEKNGIYKVTLVLRELAKQLFLCISFFA